MTQMPARAIAAAEIFGAIAFAGGKPRVPVHDPNVIEMVRGLMPGEGAAEILESWLHGWTAASLVD
jgi:hypothetical protein